MTRPSGMRAELRNWYYNTKYLRWEGYIYNDLMDTIQDATFVAIYAKDLEEVIPMIDITVFQFKSGVRYYALNSERRADT